MSPTVRTLDGILRVYAKTAPTVPIKAHLALLGVSPYNGKIGGIGGNVSSLPVATADTPGAVKPGDGLSITADGTLSVDTATDAEFHEAMTDVFG